MKNHQVKLNKFLIKKQKTKIEKEGRWTHGKVLEWACSASINVSINTYPKFPIELSRLSIAFSSFSFSLSRYTSCKKTTRLPSKMAGIIQDWEPVVIRKKAPTAAARKDEKAVNAARRAGAEIETVRKCAYSYVWFLICVFRFSWSCFASAYLLMHLMFHVLESFEMNVLFVFRFSQSEGVFNSYKQLFDRWIYSSHGLSSRSVNTCALSYSTTLGYYGFIYLSIPSPICVWVCESGGLGTKCNWDFWVKTRIAVFHPSFFY